jgi:molybdopterin/thiamine biosynthesis adenylyltransferase
MAKRSAEISRVKDTGANPYLYEEAFSRNLGWVTPGEQTLLRRKRVAIAGLGGVGGVHMLTLARLGIGAFTIAESDAFELANFNRQIGASVSTLGQRKAEVMTRMALDINPELDIKILPDGVDARTVDEFLEGADAYLDGLDFFAFSAREAVFDACAKRGIPATTVAPLGMGAALLNFVPGGMTFEEYFRWRGCSDEERAIRFLAGLAPRLLQRRYLVDAGRVDLNAGRGPSTAMSCMLCAGVAATEVLKILLRRGEVLAAPRGLHFDPYLNKLVRTWRPMGNRNPLQRALIAFAKHQLRAKRNALPERRARAGD